MQDEDWEHDGSMEVQEIIQVSDRRWTRPQQQQTVSTGGSSGSGTRSMYVVVVAADMLCCVAGGFGVASSRNIFTCTTSTAVRCLCFFGLLDVHAPSSSPHFLNF